MKCWWCKVYLLILHFVNRIFKIKNREQEQVDVVKHTQSILDQFKDVEIYVGCDSQNKQRGCVYATVIAYRFTHGEGTRRAASFIYSKESVDKQKDKFTRLWGEVERSVEVALWLQQQGFKVHQVDLDFNQDTKTGSHDMVASGTGYVKGFGFNVSTKPETQVASRCGDHIVKKRGSVRRRVHNRKKKIRA